MSVDFKQVKREVEEFMKYFRRGGLAIFGIFDCCDVCFEDLVFEINEVGDGGRFDIVKIINVYAYKSAFSQDLYILENGLPNGLALHTPSF